MIRLTQASLIKKRVQFADTTLACVSVFPLFTSVGKVEALLLADHLAGRLYAVDWSKSLVKKPWFRDLRVLRKVANLQPLTIEKAYQLTRYWHYDPSGTLKGSLFDEQSTAEPFKSTNSFETFGNIGSVYFRRDLGQLESMLRQQGDNINFVSLRDEPLPEREEESVPLSLLEGSRVGQWKLSPFWERGRAQKKAWT